MLKAIAFFKKTYPSLRIVEVRRYKNGYFIIATNVPKGEIDCNDPYYFVNDEGTLASAYPVVDITELQKILQIKPIRMTRHMKRR